MRSKTMQTKFTCECFDTCCPVHKGRHCLESYTTTLYRTDMLDIGGTRFCEACANDAMEFGVFSEERQ
jgi:hypothetical protein